jgi:hypothetical protein
MKRVLLFPIRVVIIGAVSLLCVSIIALGCLLMKVEEIIGVEF